MLINNDPLIVINYQSNLINNLAWMYKKTIGKIDCNLVKARSFYYSALF